MLFENIPTVAVRKLYYSTNAAVAVLCAAKDDEGVYSLHSLT